MGRRGGILSRPPPAPSCRWQICCMRRRRKQLPWYANFFSGDAEFPLLFGRAGCRGEFFTSPRQWYTVRVTMPWKAIRAQSKCLLPCLDKFCLSPRASSKKGVRPQNFGRPVFPKRVFPVARETLVFRRRKGVHCGGDARPRDSFVAQVVGDGATFRQNAKLLD